MKDGPNIVGIAALIGDHARAEVLTALMADRALTATELADVAGVTKQTISAHLAKLVDAGLVAVESQGRHRYFRLADHDVAHLLESLMGVAFRTGAVRARASPREPALRKARVCYDHLAGEVGVSRLREPVGTASAGCNGGDGLALTADGQRLFRDLRIDTAALATAEARVLPRLPRLERAPPSSGRRAGRGAARAHHRAGMGEDAPRTRASYRSRRAASGRCARCFRRVAAGRPPSASPGCRGC